MEWAGGVAVVVGAGNDVDKFSLGRPGELSNRELCAKNAESWEATLMRGEVVEASMGVEWADLERPCLSLAMSKCCIGLYVGGVRRKGRFSFVSCCCDSQQGERSGVDGGEATKPKTGAAVANTSLLISGQNESMVCHERLQSGFSVPPREGIKTPEDIITRSTFFKASGIASAYKGLAKSRLVHPNQFTVMLCFHVQLDEV